MKKKFRENISDIFELPKDTFVSLPQIILTGNREIYIDNYKGIIEYGENTIRINTGEKILKISGNELDIKGIGENDITVDGDILTVEFM